MKQYSIFVVIATVAGALFGATTTPQLLTDSTYSKTGTLSNYNVHHYDTQGRDIVDSTYKSGKVPFGYTINSYNTAGKLSSAISYNAAKQKTALSAFTYDANGRVTFAGSSVYTPSTGVISDSEGVFYFYNADGTVKKDSTRILVMYTTNQMTLKTTTTYTYTLPNGSGIVNDPTGKKVLQKVRLTLDSLNHELKRLVLDTSGTKIATAYFSIYNGDYLTKYSVFVGDTTTANTVTDYSYLGLPSSVLQGIGGYSSDFHFSRSPLTAVTISGRSAPAGLKSPGLLILGSKANRVTSDLLVK